MSWKNFIEALGFMCLWALVTLGLSIVLATCNTCSRSAHASPLNCEFIQNDDARHYCLALSKHDKTECDFIKRHDLREECRARVLP